MQIITGSTREYCAEIAQSHDGSLGYVLTVIEALAKRGVDTIKFQLHLPEFESTLSEDFRIKMPGQDASRFDYWVRTGFRKSDWVTIKEKCEFEGVEFLCTPFSPQAVEILESLEVERYKIASGDLNNVQLLNEVRSTKKPIILSTGMSNIREVQTAVDFLGNSIQTLLHCVTSYPLSEENVNFGRMVYFKQQFPNLQVGYSDHTGKVHVANWAFALGATFVEQHVVYSREQYGPDSSSSITLDEIEEVIKFRNYGNNLNLNMNQEDLPSAGSEQVKRLFGRGLATIRDIQPGESIVLEDLTMKKPTGPMSWEDRHKILGLIAVEKISKYTHLEFENLREEGSE